MRVLITGAAGFAGSHLADFLAAKRGVEIHGLKRRASSDENLKHLGRKIHLHNCDLSDASGVSRLLKKIRPERIHHLAAKSFVVTSWDHPAQILSANIFGELNLLEAVRNLKLSCAVHIAGSSEEYGEAPVSEFPLSEKASFRPLSPYGVSKVAQELLAYQYGRSYGIKVVTTRAFSHTGPRQSGMMVAGSFAKQIALIEAGKQAPVLRVGNLESSRDFTDVRDVVRAYWLALEKGRSGEAYNVCSGKTRKVRDILKIYLAESCVKIRVERDLARLRKIDTPGLVGDASKLKKQTGWRPEIPFEKTLKDLLNFWREKIGS